MRAVVRLVAGALTVLALSSALRTAINETQCGEAQVYIFVSPLKSGKEVRALEVHWVVRDAQVGDYISIYNYDPVQRTSGPLGRLEPVRTASKFPHLYSNNPPHYADYGYAGERRDGPAPAAPSAAPPPPLAVVSTDGMPTGFRATHLIENRISDDQLGYEPRCLGYWATYERLPPGAGGNESDILAVSCLRTQPTWMWTYRDAIGSLPLYDTFIPGTHDSAANRESSKVLDRYSITQDESVLAQLIYGIRYIDLRVGFYPNKEVKWWANHGPLRIQPLLVVLHEIKAFMDNTKEIVILDIQEFPSGFGKDNSVHLKLVHLLDTELGELMAMRDGTRGWSSSLNDIWNHGRRLIVGYDKEAVLPASRKLWVSVRQFWADAQTPRQLTDYTASLMSRPPSGFPWALMAELTLNARHLATHPTASLRRLAHQVNQNVTYWMRGRWATSFNVVAVDFSRYTGVVDAAIINNLLKSQMTYCQAFQLMNSD